MAATLDLIAPLSVTSLGGSLCGAALTVAAGLVTAYGIGGSNCNVLPITENENGAARESKTQMSPFSQDPQPSACL